MIQVEVEIMRIQTVQQIMATASRNIIGFVRKIRTFRFGNFSPRLFTHDYLTLVIRKIQHIYRIFHYHHQITSSWYLSNTGESKKQNTLITVLKLNFFESWLLRTIHSGFIVSMYINQAVNVLISPSVICSIAVISDISAMMLTAMILMSAI